MKLTKEQAIIISGYTGVTACPFHLLHEDVEQRLGLAVLTHEFGDRVFAEQVKKLYREDFIALCFEGE